MTLIIILIMLTAGIAGGIVNVALAHDTRTEKASSWKSLMTGIGAAFLMPLFLNTMSSNLLSEIFKKSSDAEVELLVFGAFCLLAAISSKVFIQTLSDKVLNEARAARQQAEKASSIAQVVEATAEEAKELALIARDTATYGLGQPNQALTPTEGDFLQIQRGPDDEDPWAGQFGGHSTSNGRRLEASIKPLTVSADWVSIRLSVKSTDAEKFPLTGNVQFYIHPSFGNYELTVPVLGGEATLNISAWGAFTVGALADGGKTKLELDLSQQPDAPEPFKSR